MGIKSTIQNMMDAAKKGVLSETREFVESKIREAEETLSQKIDRRFDEAVTSAELEQVASDALTEEDVREIVRKELEGRRADIRENVMSEVADNLDTLRSSVSDDLDSAITEFRTNLPELVEGSLDSLFSSLADDIASATELDAAASESSLSAQVRELEEGDDDTFSFREKKIFFALQHRYEQGENVTSYRDIEPIAGFYDPNAISSVLTKAEKNGWLERERVSGGQQFTMFKRLPDATYKEVAEDLEISA